MVSLPLLYLAFTLAFPATTGAPPPTVPTALTLALAIFLLPLITLGIDQVRPSPGSTRTGFHLQGSVR